MAITIRLASLDDAKSLLDIYRYYVEETAITFEYDVPTLEEFTGRMRSIMAFYPYLVAEEDGKILGYDYASKFHPRAAYAWSAEVTVYLDKAARGKGVGRQIYGKLEDYLTQMGILNLNACIASTDVEDAYLTNGSEKFHRALGYQLVGKFHDSGYKFNRWYDMIWMEKYWVSMERTLHQLSLFMRLQKKLNFYELGFLSCLFMISKTLRLRSQSFLFLFSNGFLGKTFLALALLPDDNAYETLCYHT